VFCLPRQFQLCAEVVADVGLRKAARFCGAQTQQALVLAHLRHQDLRASTNPRRRWKSINV